MSTYVCASMCGRCSLLWEDYPGKKVQIISQQEMRQLPTISADLHSARIQLHTYTHAPRNKYNGNRYFCRNDFLVPLSWQEKNYKDMFEICLNFCARG